MTIRQVCDEIVIRALASTDPEPIAAAFGALGWDKPVKLYRRYLDEQRAGVRVGWVAEWGGEFAGYCTLLWESSYEPFRAAGIPEISDLNVLPRFRGRGIGGRLLDAVEQMALNRCGAVGLGVGLSADYGAAQRIYVRRGYLPDGRGIVYGDRPVPVGAAITVDDDAVLMMVRDCANHGSMAD
ncbi:GNAT family N-acetyltransferase [Nocardia sp. CDC159]|uniref:GNAT family N-acetyltransferase n=1 Tax=Nocardia pulmonis TaxID=2951408 RepID=A0A9X2EDF5_9NOCA|nr:MULTISPECIES: GNAT family N-acetyltransferase [Nocardia]MCM6778772.1 GNAT family N-acetyltransferase [Nocardia pulmonis]MCM6791661.1 GNAT family N-acetyltransferase [Nocardia sp. CDC159]